jgi:hypothetical protein
VGVFFVTQNPIDIPEEVAGQLGNRVQHALRAFTKRDQRAIKAAAETFRINDDLDTEEVITELKVGEALVSTLDEDGAPTVVQRTLIKPPRSPAWPGDAKERAIIQSVSPFDGKYDEPVDRESAEEVLLPRLRMRRYRRGSGEQMGEEEVRKRSRKTTSIWEKAISRGTKVAAGGLAGALRGQGAGQEKPRQSGRIGHHLCGRLDRDGPCRADCRALRAQPDRRVDALRLKRRTV